MDFTLSPEDLALKQEMRAWIEENLPPSLKHRATKGFHPPKEDIRDWMRILAGKGWAGRNWPGAILLSRWLVSRKIRRSQRI